MTRYKGKLLPYLKQNQFPSALLTWQQTPGGAQRTWGCCKELSMLFENLWVCIDWICYSTTNIIKKKKKVQSVTALKVVKTEISHHKPSLASWRIWSNDDEISFKGTKSSCRLTDGPCYMIVQRTAASIQCLFSLRATVHSLMPISNFSKCASITCWTKQRSKHCHLAELWVFSKLILITRIVWALKVKIKNNNYIPVCPFFTPRKETVWKWQQKESLCLSQQTSFTLFYSNQVWQGKTSVWFPIFGYGSRTKSNFW